MTSPTERLDEETELRISGLCGGWDALSTSKAVSALRSRIRTLLEEARKEERDRGNQLGTQIGNIEITRAGVRHG